MSINTLEDLGSRYPALGGWLDLSGFLSNGWEPAHATSVGVAVLPDVAIFNMRIRGDNATAWQLTYALPEDLAQRQSYLAAVSPKGATVAQILASGRIQIPSEAQGHVPDGLSASDRAGVWTITGAIPRGTA